MQVAGILKTKGSAVTTVTPGMRIADAVRVLSKHRIGAVLVLGEDGKIAGILSERDIVRGLADHGERLHEMPVSEFMTKTVITCTLVDSVEEIMRQMTTRRVRHLPVLADGKLAGIVSIGD